MYQVGLCFQAGFVTLWVNASVEISTCDSSHELRLIPTWNVRCEVGSEMHA